MEEAMKHPYLSVSELAELLRVSEKWVYQRLAERAIPGAFKIGGTWFIDREIFEHAVKTAARTFKDAAKVKREMGFTHFRTPDLKVSKYHREKPLS